VIEATDKTHYLNAVLREFRDDADTLTGFELRKKLWHSCVVVCEVTKTGYEDWHVTLAKFAVEAGISPREVMATVKSARRKAGVA
jgi:hypothetical protein